MLRFVQILLVTVSSLFASDQAASVNPKVIPVVTAEPVDGKVYPIAVIGAGAAGIMAAKRAVLNNQEVLLFTGAKKEIKNARGNWVRKVDNMPGFESYTRTVVELRDKTMHELVSGPFRDKFFIIPDSVLHIEKKGDLFCLKDGNEKSYLVRYVVLATGMMDTQPEIQGSIKPILKYANKQLVNYCLLCDGHKALHKRVAVIGHSEEALKAAIVLKERYSSSSVVIVTNGNMPQFSEELLKKHDITLYTEAIESLLGNAEEYEFTGFQLQTEKVDADLAFVMLGIRPNNMLAKLMGVELDEKGLVVTDENGETAIENLFVIGDLRSGSMKQIYTAWQHAVTAVQVIDRRCRA